MIERLLNTTEYKRGFVNGYAEAKEDLNFSLYMVWVGFPDTDLNISSDYIWGYGDGVAAYQEDSNG